MLRTVAIAIGMVLAGGAFAADAPPNKVPYTVYSAPAARPAAHYASPYSGFRASGSHKAIGGSGLVDGKAK